MYIAVDFRALEQQLDYLDKEHKEVKSLIELLSSCLEVPVLNDEVKRNRLLCDLGVLEASIAERKKMIEKIGEDMGDIQRINHELFSELLENSSSLDID